MPGVQPIPSSSHNTHQWKNSPEWQQGCIADSFSEAKSRQVSCDGFWPEPSCNDETVCGKHNLPSQAVNPIWQACPKKALNSGGNNCKWRQHTGRYLLVTLTM